MPVWNNKTLHLVVDTDNGITNKWCNNNPNNSSNNQDCGYIWILNQGNKYGCWDDTACSNNKQSIIEFDL